MQIDARPKELNGILRLRKRFKEQEMAKHHAVNTFQPLNLSLIFL
jgi:hypothetical protein